jgi:phosphatidylglycerophosphate synthase
MNWRQIFWPANLLSLARVALALPLGYCLSLRTPEGTIAAVVILVAAGVTDFLDGYLARRSGRISSLGAALDPVADKVFVAALVLLFGGLILLKRNRPTIPARLYGKYLFFATIFLLGGYIMEYRFGAAFSTVFVLGLCVVSLIDYAFLFGRVSRGGEPPLIDDKRRWRTVRVLITALAVVIYLIGWIIENPG